MTTSNTYHRLDGSHPGTELEKRVMRKITWRLLPVMVVLMTINYLDRVNIGFAGIPMREDLGLTAKMFGMAAGIFFIGYVLFEVPSNMALAKFGARLWIARIVFTWGVVATAMAVIQGPTSLYVLRFLLGVAEAGFGPGMIFYVTLWFPAQYRARVLAAFLAAVPVSYMLGAPLSALMIEHSHDFLGLAGWRWMFLLQGVPSILLTIVVLVFLIDSPAKAKWLNTEEKDWIVGRLEAERAPIAREAHGKGILKSVINPRVLVLGITYMGVALGIYSISFFFPQIIAEFEKLYGMSFSVTQIGFLAGIPYGLAAIAMILWGISSDRRNERRIHFVIPAVASAVAITLTPSMQSATLAMATVAVAAIGVHAALGVFWDIPARMLAGTAAAAGIALVNSIGQVGGFVGPYAMGWLRDATGNYNAGLYMIAGFMLLSAVAVFSLRITRQSECPAPPEAPLSTTGAELNGTGS